MTAALSALGELLGLGAKDKDPPSAEELKAKLQKVALQIKKVRAQLKKTKSSSQKAEYKKQFKALRKRLLTIKKLLAKHKDDKSTEAEDSTESEESEDLSGPVLDRVGGFVCRRPIVSLLLAGIGGAILARRMA